MLKGFSKGQSECHQLDTARECHRKMSELGKKIKEMNNATFNFSYQFFILFPPHDEGVGVPSYMKGHQKIFSLKKKEALFYVHLNNCRFPGFQWPVGEYISFITSKIIDTQFSPFFCLKPTAL